MKKNCRILTAMLLALTCCPSCSDKDNELSTTSRISFYGETYPLEQGAIYHDNNHTVIAVSDYTFEDRYQGKDGEQTDLIKGFSAEVKEKQTGNFLIGLYQHGFVLSDLTKDARGNGACICLRLASRKQTKSPWENIPTRPTGMNIPLKDILAWITRRDQARHRMN